MSPSIRSRSNHPRTDRSAVLTVPGPRPVHRRSGRLRPYPAGSPVAHAVSSSLPFGTKPLSAAASHPALRRRSCLRLPRGSCLRGGHDFHMLSSWCCGRTERGILPRLFRNEHPSDLLPLHFATHRTFRPPRRDARLLIHAQSPHRIRRTADSCLFVSLRGWPEFTYGKVVNFPRLQPPPDPS